MFEEDTIIFPEDLKKIMVIIQNEVIYLLDLNNIISSKIKKSTSLFNSYLLEYHIKQNNVYMVDSTGNYVCYFLR